MHLPRYPSGATVHFFIDPFAGCERVLDRDGRRHFLRREQRGFHCFLIPTREYRERFGYLALSHVKRQWMISRHRMGECIPGDAVPAIADDSRRLRPFPPQIEEVGAVHLTAASHPFSGHVLWWDRPTLQQPGAIDWPEESGGAQTLRRLFARSRELLDGAALDANDRMEITGECGSDLVDPVVHELLIPERERQQRAMVAAMRRVTKLINGQTRIGH